MRHQKRFQDNVVRTCGINLQKAQALIEAGYGRLHDLRVASDEKLLAVQGIGPSQLKKIRDAIGGG